MKLGWPRLVALLFAVSSTARWGLSSSEIDMDTVEINTPVGATTSYIRVLYSRHICSIFPVPLSDVRLIIIFHA
jgi:hypothetical protein